MFDHHDVSPLMPRCFVCNKMVEMLQCFRDAKTCATVFVAYCHGKRQEAIVTDEDFHDRIRLGAGIAFMPPVAENAPKPDAIMAIADK